MPDRASKPALISSSSFSASDLDGEKISIFFLAILIVYAAIRSVCQAATRPLWYDEICTLIMVRQGRISTMWSALKQGADGQPPVFYLAERYVTMLAPSESIAFRLLSIFGFVSTVLCLFLLIRRRRGSVVALLCAAIPVVTVLYDNFAVESRPYALVVACISFALLCYQRAPSARWMIPMGLSLALAESFHYYAVFAFSPFFVAEGICLLEERKPRWVVWQALGCGFLPLVAFMPLLALSKVIYGQHFWSPPTLDMAEVSYGWYLRTSFIIGEALAAAAALAVLGTTLYVRRRRACEDSKTQGSLQEPMMILTFLSLPFIGFVVAKIAHGGMTPRYVISTVLGFPLAVGYVLPRFGRKNVLPIACISFLALVALVLVPQETMFWSSYSGHFPSPADKVEIFAGSAGRENLPVVISDAHEFMQLVHYASPAWAARFVSVVDAPQAVVYLGNDTADKELPILASYFPLHVYDFQAFAKEHPVFLLYSNNGGAGDDWWPRKLTNDGYTLRAVAVKPKYEHDYSHRIFLVSRTKDAD